MGTIDQGGDLQEVEQVMDCRSKELFLIMDQGGHASRSVMMDRQGIHSHRAERPLSTFRPREGFVEHDPLDLFETVSQSVTEVVQRSGGRWEGILAAGLATQRSSVVCWDKRTGEALSPVISWQDIRAGDQIGSMLSQANEVHRKTGLFLSAHYGASKISWCLENLPEVKKALKEGRLCAGPMSSYLVFQLTEEKLFVADPVSASRTLLWNIHEGSWDTDLLRLFKIPEEILPACVPTVYGFGSLALSKGHVPLTLVTGDQSAALFAHGRLRADTAYINMGTGAFVSRPTGEKPLFRSGLLTSTVHKQGGLSHHVLEGTVNGAGSALEWARSALPAQDLQAQLPGWLEKKDEPPLFLNGISGLGAPYWIPEFSSRFIGPGDVGQRAVAVAESIIFLLQRNLLEMENSLSAPDRIQVTGGLSKLDGLCQRLADLSGILVYRPEELEATSRGTCFLLAGMPGSWPEAGPGESFIPGEGAQIKERYRRWLEEMEKRIDRK